MFHDNASAGAPMKYSSPSGPADGPAIEAAVNHVDAAATVTAEWRRRCWVVLRPAHHVRPVSATEARVRPAVTPASPFQK